MDRPSGLGRGLGSLIPQAPVAAGDTDEIGLRDIPIDAVRPNRYQPRDNFDESTLDALAASVKELGVLQPVLVRALADQDGVVYYELIAGERRWRAARRVGLTTLPAIIRPADDKSSLEQAVVENLHRENLNPLEEAAAYQQLIDEFDLSQHEVAKRVGKSRPAVANTLRLFQLPPSVQRFVLDGSITAGHARALLGLQTEAEQLALAQRVVDEGLNVRMVEALVRGDVVVDVRDEPAAGSGASGPSASGEPEPGRTRRGRRTALAKDAAVLELEQRLANALQTSVDITVGQGKGRIVID
ncbi:MAG: ParB/RepB/Spo0J family partition protein, partial [Acidimicrobiales bacterium]|nr:ParB/RepB/Spo0J family partition protein [Acidimicrobiales bacterium]